MCKVSVGLMVVSGETLHIAFKIWYIFIRKSKSLCSYYLPDTVCKVIINISTARIFEVTFNRFNVHTCSEAVSGTQKLKN